MSFLAELKRRNVFRVAIAYVLLGWAVLQGADFLLDLAGAPDWVIRVFVIAGLVGLPFAIFFAWAYELTPEGIKREKDIDRSQSITPRTGKRLDRIIIGLLLLVIALMAVERFYFTGGATPGEESAAADLPKTIAVLPFADLSQAQDQGWFADGLAEEILNALVKVPDLQVAARTASFAYKESDKTFSEIAAELGVAHLLEGSVRSAGDRIRVTAQLIRADDGFQVWSQNYDRGVADMIGIQEDLARSIATALETTMDPEALAQMTQVGTNSLEAYQEYLRGLQARAEANSYNAEHRLELTWTAYEHFEAARSIDPDFGSAHAEAAAFWKSQLKPNLLEFGITELEPREMLREYNLRIDKAIESASSEADEIRGLADRAMMDLRLRDARQLYEQYLAVRPNDREARESLIDVLLMLSEPDAAKAALVHYRERLPRDLNSAIGFIEEIWRSGDAAAAVPEVLQATRRWTNSEQLAYQAHRALLWAGRNAEAAEIYARYETLVPQGHAVIRARHACVNGNRRAAEKVHSELDPEINNYIIQAWLILNYLGLQGDEAALLQRLSGNGAPFMLASLLVYPQFDPRPYPELMAVLEREGVNRPPPVRPPFACPPPSQPSVAVLPFVNMSADPDNEYFSHGVSEEILNVLAGIPGLKVSARTSSFSFKGSDATVAQIAKTLGVNHVLEGSVRKAGDTVRVTAQLIAADDGFHLWSATFDRELTDIFAIQDEIANAIADALKVTLLPPVDQPNLTGTTNLEAYELFIQGVDLWHQRSGDSLERALALFQRAVDLDPGFARAHAWLALTWAVIPDYGDRPFSDARVEGLKAAEKALEHDPHSIEAQTALISPLLGEGSAVVAAMIERGEELIALNTSFATTYQWHANNLAITGRTEDAMRNYRRALDFDPLSRIIHQNLAAFLLALGRYDETEDLLRRLESIDPDYWDGAHTRFLLYLLTGRIEEARREGERLVRILGRKRNAVDLYLDLVFEPDRKAQAAAEIMGFPHDSFWDPDNPSLLDSQGLPIILSSIGQNDDALQALRRIQGDDIGGYIPALVRLNVRARDFMCQPEVIEFYAEISLLPLPDPPDC